ncbi:MAG TPA: isoprenyl transferase [Alphaproteobacteria bacterium]|jgi:undecaprenyl diphosphate synthase|nr:isoprenyl transferase [Alphaproteobacteria bacterium]
MSDARDPVRVASAAPAPVHVAIIMDGNGRWAKARGLPRVAGHRHGADAVRQALEGCGELGIRYLTLFGFSSENWKRPASEIDDLMGLLRHYLRGEIAELHAKGVRVRVIGDRTRLARDIVALIGNAESMTRENTALHLTVALNYGGRAEIARAARALARQAREGRVDPEKVDETMFARHLYTADLPDPDLIIRTSGEQRVSNFLLWQSAYAEFVFIDTLWPDFSKRDLAEAVREFQRRDRRFGAAGA